jgi:hypothetical protein
MLRSVHRRAAIATMVAAVLIPVTPQAIAGPDWVEIGVAGSLFDTAQIPTPLGGGPLNSIQGNLDGPGDFSDMYIIGVADPALFNMQIASANFNAQLFIFHITLAGGAYGLLGNDDRAIGDNRPLLTPVATDGTGARLDLPGDYLIGISGFGHNPVSSTGLIFNMATTTEISGADGPGGFNRHIGWDGPGVAGSYMIALEGVVFPAYPSPGTAASLAMGLILLGRRRR